MSDPATDTSEHKQDGEQPFVARAHSKAIVHDDGSDVDSDDSNADTDDEHIAVHYSSVKNVGVSQDKNSRYRRTMEDAHVVVDAFGGDKDQGYFAIYDGHGGRGAVDFTAANLHLNLASELQKDASQPIDALRKAYKSTDVQIGENQIQFSGTTSVSALIRKQGTQRWLYTANAGDARAVLNRGGTAVRLTYDHKGSDAQETKRIVDAGGFVVLHRVNGILAVTRSLGDHAMKDYVISDPYCMETLLEPTDTHLILACDGLWDVASDQDAVNLVIQEKDAPKMSEKLLMYALKNGSTDNISVMVLEL